MDASRVESPTKVDSAWITLTQGPVGSIYWHLPQDDFVGAVTQAIRTNDRVAVMAATLSMASEADHLAHQSDSLESLTDLLDRAVSVAALGLVFEAEWAFVQGLKVLRTVYDNGTHRSGSARGDLEISSPVIWLEVVTRVEALGGLAIRMKQWDAVRQLTLHLVGVPGEHLSWLRHASVNSKGLDRSRDLWLSTLAGRARTYVQAVAVLRPDYPRASSPDEFVERVGGPEEPVLVSILQFDLAWSLVAQAEATRSGRTNDYGEFNTSIAQFKTLDAWQLAELVIDNAEVRCSLFHDDAESTLRVALEAVVKGAQATVANDCQGFTLLPQTVKSFLGR